MSLSPYEYLNPVFDVLIAITYNILEHILDLIDDNPIQ